MALCTSSVMIDAFCSPFSPRCNGEYVFFICVPPSTFPLLFHTSPPVTDVSPNLLSVGWHRPFCKPLSPCLLTGLRKVYMLENYLKSVSNRGWQKVLNEIIFQQTKIWLTWSPTHGSLKSTRSLSNRIERSVYWSRTHKMCSTTVGWKLYTEWPSFEWEAARWWLYSSNTK